MVSKDKNIDALFFLVSLCWIKKNINKHNRREKKQFSLTECNVNTKENFSDVTWIVWEKEQLSLTECFVNAKENFPVLS